MVSILFAIHISDMQRIFTEESQLHVTLVCWRMVYITSVLWCLFVFAKLRAQSIKIVKHRVWSVNIRCLWKTFYARWHKLFSRRYPTFSGSSLCFPIESDI